jgi:hypothetical protein
MSIAQIIENGVVVNCIVVDPAAAISPDGSKLVWPAGEFDAPAGATFMMQAGASIGWTLSGGELVAPPAPPAPPPSIPASVSDLQFRLALNASGLREQAEAYIATASQDVKDWWDRATRIDRDNPMLAAAVTAIGKTPADRDALFTLAATL